MPARNGNRSTNGGHDPASGTYRRTVDGGSDEPLHVAIASTLAVATGRDATSLEPLQSALDVDALCDPFAPGEGRSSEAASLSLRFEHEGRAVLVRAGGEIVVAPLDGDRD